jgi:signal transduction histidine kinase
MGVSDQLRTRLRRYRFEIRHIIVLVTVLIVFQIILGFFQTSLLDKFLNGTKSWFQKYYAERIAIVTSAGLELLYQNQQRLSSEQDTINNPIVYSLNVFLKQQMVQRSVEDIKLILQRGDGTYVINNGQALQSYLRGTLAPLQTDTATSPGVRFFHSVQNDLRYHEKVLSTVEGQETFDVLVPFVPNGEYLGALYMRMRPDFGFLTEEVQSNFNQVSLIFSALILVGLIAIFLVSSRAVKERDEAQRRLFIEHEESLGKQIQLEKESLFTKRIYHTHHKAEKIMGFIKQDVRRMNPANLDELKRQVITYSNFISRIIYDMKWYDQDINTIVNPIFHTNINTVIDFIVKHVFLRLSTKNEMFRIEEHLDPALPNVHVNEFIVWEILEPLIQNSIDHGGRHFVTISVTTRHDPADCITWIFIEDNGEGIKPELLEVNPRGTKRLFLERETTKKGWDSHSGYGCYIAYQLAVGKCGWALDAENLPGGGCRFSIAIKGAS